ncbi:LysE family translocator [bacterium]|nr:LysE family translocator [bacterium]NUN45446.1 LysE family translocator [bacterium]
METSDIVLFFTATLLLNLSPGPDMIYVIARSIGQGKLAGVVSSLGIFAGCFFHIIAASLGLTALLETVPLAFDIIKYTGSGYLIYLGIRILNAGPPAEGETVRSMPLWAIFRQGAITNILNPKVALFFVAFLPQFVNPHDPSARFQMASLGLFFNTSGTIVNILVAIVSSYAGVWIKQSLKNASWFNRFTGLAMIVLGIRLALQRKK